ncbi:type IV secretion system protein [Sodalis endosymbiont of Spalangia cameroni]
MKPTCIAAVLLSLSLSVSAEGILVFDPTAKLENARQWAKEAKQWMETVKHYKAEINAYKDQLATATGLRDIQGLVSQAKGLKDDIKALQKQGISLNDLLMSDSPVTGDAKRLYARYSAFDDCEPKAKEQSASYAMACEKNAINKGYVLQQTMDVQTQVNRALEEIGQLTDRIANAKDSKESQDLANTIQAKSVQLNSLTRAWEMNVKAAEQRDKLAEQKKRKAFEEQQYNAPIPHFGDLGS